jgi:hypothetical protein
LPARVQLNDTRKGGADTAGTSLAIAVPMAAATSRSPSRLNKFWVRV